MTKQTQGSDISGLILNDSRYEIAPYKKRNEMTFAEAMFEKERERIRDRDATPIMIYRTSLDSNDYSTSNAIVYTEKPINFELPKVDFKIFEPPKVDFHIPKEKKYNQW